MYDSIFLAARTNTHKIYEIANLKQEINWARGVDNSHIKKLKL